MKMASLMQQWNAWELQALVLLSLVLQVFLFFFGGLRRRGTSAALRFLIWLAYMSADFIAVYALGHLSRQKTDGESYQLAFLWTPFLLIHLGGQDTITAFSVEDNELWLRHLLYLIVQVGLALYVFWKSAAHNGFIASTVCAFVAGIIKYGERTWALKSATHKAIRNSTGGGEEIRQIPQVDSEYLTMVKFALSCSPGVRNLFAGRRLVHMEERVARVFASTSSYLPISENSEHAFKVLDMELGMMYDTLFTKARVIRTWAGAILRFVTLISLLVAFVLFFTGNKWHHSRVDVAITYTLFIGAFCLEVCAIFDLVVTSAWTWAFFSSRKCDKLAHIAWYIFKSVRLESKPLWSNSMGQYNFLDSCFPADSVIRKIMNLVGAGDFWRDFRHTKRADVETGTKELLFGKDSVRMIFNTPVFPPNMSARPYRPPSSVVNGFLDDILQKPFEVAVLALHIYTDMFLHRADNASSCGSTSTEDRQHSCSSTEDRQHLMHTCRTISEYMCYLLVVYPEMLPVSGSARDVLDKASDSIAKMTRVGLNTKHAVLFFDPLKFVSAVFGDPLDPWTAAMLGFRLLKEEDLHDHETLQAIRHGWYVLLLYAAAKSHGAEHAKHLSMGGEFLTFLWLHLAHLDAGDLGTIPLDLLLDLDPVGRARDSNHVFLWEVLHRSMWDGPVRQYQLTD